MTLRHVVMWTMAAGDAATRAEHAGEVARRLSALVVMSRDVVSATRP